MYKVPLNKFLKKIFIKESLLLHPLPSYLPLEISTTDKLDPKKETIDILLITGDTKNKNIHNTIKIIETIFNYFPKKSHKYPVFHLIGINKSFKFNNIYENNIINYGKNIITSDLANLHLKCDFYLSLSSQEGFGIPLLDTLLLGLYPIISEIETYKEIISSYKYLDFKHLFIDLDNSFEKSSKLIIKFIRKYHHEIYNNKINSLKKYEKEFQKLSNINKVKIKTLIN